MLDTSYLRSVGIDESTIRRIERDNTYKEQYSESMRDEWCYQDDNYDCCVNVNKIDRLLR